MGILLLKGEEELQPWANVALVLLPARIIPVFSGNKDGKSDPTCFTGETTGGNEQQEIFDLLSLPGEPFLPLHQCFVLDLAEF